MPKAASVVDHMMQHGTVRTPRSDVSTGVVVAYRGRVAALQAEYLGGAVERQLERRGVAGGARVRLTGPNRDHGPMVVQVNLQVGDTSARMQAVTSRADDLQPALSRLDRQIVWLSGPWRPRPWPDHSRQVLAGVAWAEIGRRKAYVLRRGTPLQAVRVMDAMDYDVYLFTDAETGEDAVVYRAGPSGLRLARQRRMHPPGSADVPTLEPVRLTVNPYPTPTLTETAAVNRLHHHGLPFLFFTDSATGRGRLLYARYDGNLGSITHVRKHDEDGAPFPLTMSMTAAVPGPAPTGASGDAHD